MVFQLQKNKKEKQSTQTKSADLNEYRSNNTEDIHIAR